MPDKRISMSAWKEISAVLKKHSVPYTTHYVTIDGTMEYSDKKITDKHIEIRLVIPNFFEEV